MLEFGLRIFGRLFFDLSKLNPAFRLCLDNTDRLSIDKQNVIRRADIGLIFANCNAVIRREIYSIFTLHNPTARSQLRINIIAGDLFWILVGH